MIQRLAILALLPLAVATGCTSHILPLRPLQTVEVWVPDTPSTPTTSPTAATSTAASLPSLDAAIDSAPATTPATLAATTEPTTQPGHIVTKTIDPNRTSRFVYDANYDNVWKQARDLLTQTGFELDRQDYRLGVITTRPLPSSQFVEFWKAQHSEPINALENTVNNQRRWITLSIAAVEGKPEFYEIAVQVLVEREVNPGETIGGPIFVEGSGFGRNVKALRSDFATTAPESHRWSVVGHDPDLERKILDLLFKRI